MAAGDLEEDLVARRILTHGESCSGDPPHVLTRIPRLGFGYLLKKVREEPVLYCRGDRGTEGDQHAPPKVLGMFTQGGAMEALKD